MSKPSTFDFNGYTIEVPPKQQFAKGTPALGNVWPSAQPTAIVSSYLVYDFDYHTNPPQQVCDNYVSFQTPLPGAGHVDGTFRKRDLAPTSSTVTIAREVEMSYQWQAVIVELNTAGGYEQDKTFVTGVQTSEQATESFGTVISAEASTNIPLLKGIDIKLSEAYSKTHGSESKTELTTSSTVSQKVQAPANQTFIQWQLFVQHTIKPPAMVFVGQKADTFTPYLKLFDTYRTKGMPAYFPQVQIVNAPLLSSGEGIFSATMYPAT